MSFCQCLNNSLFSLQAQNNYFILVITTLLLKHIFQFYSEHFDFFPEHYDFILKLFPFFSLTVTIIIRCVL